ncbi:MAG: helix-turn-helix transcriptional regulator [Euryarchaeota archaeon]|nr:helix-turn-helix transcriptional regulator [Euryarchaeota archaeon]
MNPDCAVNKTMDYVAKKWTVMILLSLYKDGGGGTDWKRFTEIKNGLGVITPKMLSKRLRELEEEGLVENRINKSVYPVKSEYRLTEPALELMAIVQDLKFWALKWKLDNIPCSEQDCRLCKL